MKKVWFMRSFFSQLSILILFLASGCAGVNEIESATENCSASAHHNSQGPLETTPSSDFSTLEGGAVVRHEMTGLEWRRCPEGMTWTGSSCEGDAKKMSYAGALEHAGEVDGWRMPTANELTSIVERCRHAPSMNQNVFPNTPSYYFWTGSPDAEDSDGAWFVDFANADTTTRQKGWRGWARLVRDID